MFDYMDESNYNRCIILLLCAQVVRVIGPLRGVRSLVEGPTPLALLLALVTT